MFAVNGIPQLEDTSTPTYLEFGEKWTGSIKDFEKLNEIHSLSAVRFIDVSLRAKDLGFLKTLSGLQYVGLSDLKFKSGKLTDIELPPDVVSVELGGCPITNKTIDWLADTQMTSLIVSNCEMSKAAMSSIDKLRNLQAMDLRSTDLEKVIFEKWNEMQNLQRVYMSLCKFDPAGYRLIDRVRRQNFIVFNPTSFLGVQGSRGSGVPCQLDLVVSESGADKGGLKPGDTIVEVNDDPIQSFDELRMFISQYEPGEKLRLKVQRGAETLDLVTELGANTNRPIR